MTIECIRFRPHVKGCLQGFADIYIPKMGIEIYGCTLNMKNGQRWINLPSKEYKDRETGETKYSNIVRFPDAEHFKLFQEAVKEAVDRWSRENPHEQAPEAQQQPQHQEAMPF